MVLAPGTFLPAIFTTHAHVFLLPLPAISHLSFLVHDPAALDVVTCNPVAGSGSLVPNACGLQSVEFSMRNRLSSCQIRS